LNCFRMTSEIPTVAGAVRLVLAGLLASGMALVWVLGVAASVSINDGPASTYDDGLDLLWSMRELSGSAVANATSPDGTSAPAPRTAGHVYGLSSGFVSPSGPLNAAGEAFDGVPEVIYRSHGGRPLGVGEPE